MLDALLQFTAGLALAALFLAAALHKVFTFARWPAVLEQYRLLPAVLVMPAAVLLPAAEALAGLLLLSARTRPAGAVAAIMLLLAYAAALAVNLRRGRTSIDCGCFGARRRAGIARWMVLRNLLLALFALLLLLPDNARALTPLEMACGLLAVATLALLYPVLQVVLQPPPPSFDENLRASRARWSH